jgi:hypothetical protein
MDSNEAIVRLRVLAEEVIRQCEQGKAPHVLPDTAQSFAETFQALDGYLVRGGDLPGSWARCWTRIGET